MTANSDVDEEVVEEEEEEEEVPRKRTSPLRLILLILLALVGVCVLCYLAGPLVGGLLPFPIPGLPGAPTSAPTPAAPSEETPTAIPTGELVPPGETASPAPGTEQPAPTQEPGTEQPLPTQEPGTEQPLPTQEPGTEQPLPTQEPGTEQPLPTQEPGTEQPSPTEQLVEGTATATTVPVPGPTATPTLGGTAEPTVQADCANNQPPVAEAGGPYQAMMGKGLAFVAVDGSGSTDSDGTITSYEWDFGDGSTDSGQKVTYGYSSTGDFTITLTVTDNCEATAADEAQVTIVGPTPPASSGTPTPSGQSNATPAAEQPPDSGNGTPGFCYRVEPGNTLSGIAWYFGVPLPDLAAVNGVSPEYFVIAGQGLFIPAMPPQPGPNFYEVEPGDTFYSIAFQCGLPAAKLADANGVAPDEGLTPGQMVVIPPWGWY